MNQESFLPLNHRGRQKTWFMYQYKLYDQNAIRASNSGFVSSCWVPLKVTGTFILFISLECTYMRRWTLEKAFFAEYKVKNRFLFIESTTKDFQDVLNTNLLAMAVFSKEAITSMRDRKFAGHVFNINRFVNNIYYVRRCAGDICFFQNNVLCGIKCRKNCYIFRYLRLRDENHTFWMTVEIILILSFLLITVFHQKIYHDILNLSRCDVPSISLWSKCLGHWVCMGKEWVISVSKRCS